MPRRAHRLAALAACALLLAGCQSGTARDEGKHVAQQTDPAELRRIL